MKPVILAQIMENIILAVRISVKSLQSAEMASQSKQTHPHNLFKIVTDFIEELARNATQETGTELTTADARPNATCAATAEMPSLTLQMEKNAILDSK